MDRKPDETPKTEAPKPAEAPALSPEQQSQPVSFSSPLKKAQSRARGDKFSNLQQIAAFKFKKNAKNFAKKLRNEGFEVVIRKGIAKDKKTVYKVFAKKHKESSKVAVFSGEAKLEGISEAPSIENKPAIVIEEKQSVEPKESSKVAVFSGEAKLENISEASSIENKPAGMERVSLKEDKPMVRERISGDVFGRKGGYVHPFLSIAEYYTDNVFNANVDKKSDFITVISPGIWLTIPHIYEKLLDIDTSSMAPGGINLSRFKPESFRRYQTYLFYGADIERFSKYSSEDVTSHKLEGLFQYNLRGGLSIELVDQYLTSHDIRGTGLSDELDKYKTNLSNLILTCDALEKIKFRIDYANFHVNYDASRNDFRDRVDNAFSGYVFYKFQPKTSVFIEYEFIDINYNEGTMVNSREHHYFGGLQWDVTAKSKGSVKAGYGIKDFSGAAVGNSNDLVLEAQIDHRFTPKTSLIVKASRKTNETNISTTDFILSNSIEAEYIQRLTGKIILYVDLSYTNDNYKGDLTFGGEIKERKDDLFKGAFALQYQFKEWLKMDTGYIYMKRDSNFSDFNYTSNFIFIRLTSSL
jgi:hypothetical protein